MGFPGTSTNKQSKTSNRPSLLHHKPTMRREITLPPSSIFHLPLPYPNSPPPPSLHTQLHTPQHAPPPLPPPLPLPLPPPLPPPRPPRPLPPTLHLNPLPPPPHLDTHPPRHPRLPPAAPTPLLSPLLHPPLPTIPHLPQRHREDRHPSPAIRLPHYGYESREFM